LAHLLAPRTEPSAGGRRMRPRHRAVMCGFFPGPRWPFRARTPVEESRHADRRRPTATPTNEASSALGYLRRNCRGRRDLRRPERSRGAELPGTAARSLCARRRGHGRRLRMRTRAIRVRPRRELGGVRLLARDARSLRRRRPDHVLQPRGAPQRRAASRSGQWHPLGEGLAGGVTPSTARGCGRA
jgi:hypothetical protein